MRIGLLSEFVYPFHKGGAEKRFYEIATRLARRGHEVHWFGIQHWEGPPVIEYEGVRIHSASRPLEVYTAKGQRRVGAALRLGAALSSTLARSRIRFDVLDLSLYPFFHIFGSRLTNPRTPLVVTWHEFWGDHWYQYLGRAGGIGVIVERWASRIPNRVVAISDLARKGLVNSGVPASRIVTIYNGVDFEMIDRGSRGTEMYDVVFFGRLKNHKNVDVMLRAISLISKRRSAIRCVIVGDGPERDKLERLTRELGLDQNVDFRGSVCDDEMLSLVKASRIFVNPSTKEGGGSITLLEANACGVPVIAVRHPMGIDEQLVEEGRNGWWATHAEARTLADVMEKALALGAEARCAMRQRCREFAEPFDWRTITDLYETLYEEVVAHAGR